MEALKERLRPYRDGMERKIALLVPARVHPNHLTSFRVVAILLLPLADYYDMSSKTAFWLVLLAGLSDALDGITARQRRQVTQLGTALDPVADKVFAGVCLFILWHRGMITSRVIYWMMAVEAHLIIIPVLSFAYRFFTDRPVLKEFHIRPNFFGKVKMILLALGFYCLFLAEAYHLPRFHNAGLWLVYSGLCIGAMALILYMLEWFNSKY